MTYSISLKIQPDDISAFYDAFIKNFNAGETESQIQSLGG